jgi:hypothetical protein
MTLTEMSAVVTTVFLQFPHAEITKATVLLWHRALGHYPADEVSSAVVEVLLTHKSTYPPTIAHVADVLRARELQRSGAMTDGDAWELLTNSVSRFGRYNEAGAYAHIIKRSEMVAAAVRSLGWTTICGWSSHDEVGNRAHFWRVLSGLRNERTIAMTRREFNPVLDVLKKRELPRGS